MANSVCGKCGPGYPTPRDAMKGPREKLMYVICIQPDPEKSQKSDYLATVDIDPESPTFCKVISRLHTGNLKDELHHFGWNICSSCYNCKEPDLPTRNKIVMPALVSDNVYIVDTSDARSPKMHKVIPASAMHALNCATPHTTHCLPSKEIMISTLGDPLGEGKGDFVLIDTETLEMKGSWTRGTKKAKFGYDFWYQPYFDVMVASEWGAPKVFKRGYNPSADLGSESYGSSLNFYSWKSRELVQTIDLGTEGLAPLEIRFLHDPKQPQGFVGCAVHGTVYRFFRKDNGTWDTEKVISILPKKVSGWIAPHMNGMITDIVLSLDDKYLYFSNWMHGDVRQYDVSDPKHPKLTGQIFLAGKLLSDSSIKVLDDPEPATRDPVIVKGRRLNGAPQMLQLSLDGKRLYVSSSLFSPWDKQFYPDTVQTGSWMVMLDVDVENGGMKLNEDFLVDYGTEPDGPVFAHEMRYPGGDCTSEIWLAEE